MKNDSINMKNTDYAENKINSLIEETNEYYTTLEQIAKGGLELMDDIVEDSNNDDALNSREELDLTTMSIHEIQKMLLMSLRLHEIEFIDEVCIPFCNVIQHISLYRRPKDVVDELEKLNLVFNEKISLEDCFYILAVLPKKVSSVIIDSIPCRIHEKEFLYQYFLANDKDSFVSFILLKEIDCENLLKVCAAYNVKILSDALMSDPLDKKKSSLLNELFLSTFFMFSLEEYFPEMGKFINDNLEVEKLDLEPMFFIFKEVLEVYLTNRIYYTSRERQIIEKILQNPKYADIYNRILDEINQKIQINRVLGSFSNDELVLPDNYFELRRNTDDCVSIDNIKTVIKERGVETFKKFIDYVAEQGYIDNDLKTKESFAYRLTGILKPDNLLEQIEWKKDKDPTSRCLYYIVRYFYLGNGRTEIGISSLPNSRYERMKCFFVCFTEVSNPTLYATTADKNFKGRLKELFTQKLEESNP